MLTLVFILGALVELEVLPHQLSGRGVDIVGHEFLEALDLLHVSDGAQAGGGQGFEHFDPLKLPLALGGDLLSADLGELPNRENTDVPVEFLHGVVKYGAAHLVLIIRLSLSLESLDHLVLIYL